jgi:hypothetical protein
MKNPCPPTMVIRGFTSSFDYWQLSHCSKSMGSTGTA